MQNKYPLLYKGLDQIPTRGLKRIRKHINEGKPLATDGYVIDNENAC